MKSICQFDFAYFSSEIWNILTISQNSIKILKSPKILNGLKNVYAPKYPKVLNSINSVVSFLL